MVTNAEITCSINVLKSFDSETKCTVYSPLSVMNVLAAIFAGSSNKTAEEFIQIIFKGCDKDDILQHYFEIVKYCKILNMEDGLKLILSNCLFLSDKTLLPSFCEIMQKYEYEYRQLNFADLSNSIKIMNDFISQNTNEKLKNIFTENDIKNNTNLFIVNTLYFCGKWDSPFNTVYYNWFESNPSSKRKVEMMFKIVSENEKWNLTEGEEWQCLGIPYKSRNCWLHILLPKEKFGLAAILKNFNNDLFKECIMERNVKRINITLPNFQIENKINFVDILKNLGLNQIFEGCGVQKIFNKTEFVDNVMQFCNIDVNQYGTTAAAATIATMQPASKSIKEEEEYVFYANHPFAFFVTLVENNIPSDVKSVLMMGIYC